MVDVNGSASGYIDEVSKGAAATSSGRGSTHMAEEDLQALGKLEGAENLELKKELQEKDSFEEIKESLEKDFEGIDEFVPNKVKKKEQGQDDSDQEEHRRRKLKSLKKSRKNKEVTQKAQAALGKDNEGEFGEEGDGEKESTPSTVAEARAQQTVNPQGVFADIDEQIFEEEIFLSKMLPPPKDLRYSGSVNMGNLLQDHIHAWKGKEQPGGYINRRHTPSESSTQSMKEQKLEEEFNQVKNIYQQLREQNSKISSMVIS